MNHPTNQNETNLPNPDQKSDETSASGLAKSSGPRGPRFWLLWIAKCFISGFLLYLAAHNVELERLGARLADAQAVPAFGALGLLFISHFFGAARLIAVMAALQSRLQIAMACRLQFIGLFFNSALPSSVGGDTVRIWLLKRAGFPLQRAISSILIDRSSAVVAMVIIVATAQPIYGDLLQSPTLHVSIVIALLVLLVAIPIVLFLDVFPAKFQRYWLVRSVIGLIHDAQVVYLSWRKGALVVAISIMIQIITSLAYYLLATALNIEITFTACLVLLPVVILVTTLPISIGGWGVREAAAVILFGAAGVDPDGALTVSVAYGVSVLIMGAPGGILWLLERTLKK